MPSDNSLSMKFMVRRSLSRTAFAANEPLPPNHFCLKLWVFQPFISATTVATQALARTSLMAISSWAAVASAAAPACSKETSGIETGISRPLVGKMRNKAATRSTASQSLYTGMPSASSSRHADANGCSARCAASCRRRTLCQKSIQLHRTRDVSSTCHQTVGMSHIRTRNPACNDPGTVPPSIPWEPPGRRPCQWHHALSKRSSRGTWCSSGCAE
mmetsp:Transcript_62844/g.205170  ORF Transcript_62844/g.205170 Transcript_62844/m.205170 type:complete len:216 (-) Transcript_62844:787-1434(-)